jgi:glycosyltransferase involved in cell wall biosynthesis
MRHRILFVKHELAFPRASGHDIRCFEMVRALRCQGHDVGLATVVPLHQPTREQLDVPCFPLSDYGPIGEAVGVPLAYLQERFRSYWGIPPERVEAAAKTAADFQADIVVGVGLDALPLIAGAPDCVKVWYAGDEWLTHHFSLFRPLAPNTFGELRKALIMGLYERAYAPRLDRTWVVSSQELSAMRRYAGIRHVDVVSNGVDTEFFAPSPIEQAPRTAAFWGRLDFGPNLQALDWLCERIWPAVRERVPSARLTIMGFNAVDAVRKLAAADGIELRTNVPDIRPVVAANQIAVLPMISGGGIKNKLLEAAALGKAIVCTTMACSGLRGTPPAVLVDDERAWVDALVRLWERDEERRQLEQRARAWILEHHTWAAAARDVLEGLESSVSGKSGIGAAVSAAVR